MIMVVLFDVDVDGVDDDGDYDDVDDDVDDGYGNDDNVDDDVDDYDDNDFDFQVELASVAEDGTADISSLLCEANMAYKVEVQAPSAYSAFVPG